MTRFNRHSLGALAMGISLSLTASAIAAVAQPATPAQGVVRVQSAYAFDDTVTRIKADIAGKGIRFFTEID